jgi:tetratricopeptide (TPR) repeat protein
MQLQTDTLRDAANKYLRCTTTGSKDYFQAIHFLILSDFNAHDYATVLRRIDKIEAQPDFNRYPDLGCRYQYTKARAFQFEQKYDQAIEVFKSCIKYDSTNDSLQEHIRSVIVEAMLQMMNSYHAVGQYDECVSCLDSLLKHPTPIIRKYCMRDVYAYLAYATYMTDKSKQSISLINKTLSMPLYKPTPQRLFRDYSYAAAIFYYNEKNQKRTIEYCKKALNIGSKDKSIAGLGWLMNLLCNIYQDTGKIQEAINIYQWGINYSRAKGDTNGEANAYINLTDIYMDIELYEQANEFVNLAIEKTLLKKVPDPRLCIESYMRKGNVMYKLNKTDSTFYYLHKAESYARELPYSDGEALLDKAFGIMMVNMPDARNVQSGINRLRKVLTVPINATQKAHVFQELAKGLIRLHKDKEGEAMLDSMYNVMNANSPSLYIDDAYHDALQYYISKNNVPQIKRYASAYLVSNKIKTDKQTLKKLTQFVLHYNTEKQEQQLKMMNMNLNNKRLHVQMLMLLLVILFISLLSFIFIHLYKKRNYKLRHQLMEERLNDLSKKLFNSTRRRYELEDKLTNILGSVSDKEHMATVTPSLYKDKNEVRFRNNFTQLYPSFLPKLKERIPKITRNEEILCMLIALDQTPEQMIDIMCIARSSLNMDRHRLRQKMGIERGESLEDFIKSLLK